MKLNEAKEILSQHGYLMENTKSLVAKFWAKRKNGETLTPEEAEELVNAPDFEDAVNPKYQEFIKSACNKILGGSAKTSAPKAKAKTPKYKLDDDTYYKSNYRMNFEMRFVPNGRYNGDDIVVLNMNNPEKVIDFMGKDNYDVAMDYFNQALETDPDHIYVKKYKGKWIGNASASRKNTAASKIREEFQNVLKSYRYEDGSPRVITATNGEEYKPEFDFGIDFTQFAARPDTRTDYEIRRFGHGH
jgi:tetratricopeptide (TPR) repeat protein